MNWIHNHKRALLHINLAFIGGLTGVYAILVRGGNFGAAQTMNLIEMILNFAEMNLTDAFLRLAHFYFIWSCNHCSFLNRGTFFLRKILYRAGDRNCLCMDCRNHSVIRSSIDRAVPVFILNAYQWQTFTTPECYNSSTIFSTNNYKQTVLAWMRYHMTHDQSQKKRAWLFTGTLIFFHLGVLAGYFAVKHAGIHGIWFTFVPLITATCLVLPIGEAEILEADVGI